MLPRWTGACRGNPEATTTQNRHWRDLHGSGMLCLDTGTLHTNGLSSNARMYVQPKDHTTINPEHFRTVERELVFDIEIGRASCRDGLCQYVWISVGAATI